MFQREFKALSGNKFFKQRGQVAILFALMMPIFILMLGVVLDLGWYYLNVSRLQNAADAAAIAGAKTIINSENFSSYKNVTLVGKYPGKVSNEYRANDIYELTAIENGNTVANEYVAKNLSSNENNIINSWTKSEVGTEEGLYTKGDNLYYVVKLKEEIRHFFLPGWFDDMTAPVTAVALLSKTAVSDATADPTPSMPDVPTYDYSDDGDVEEVVLDDEQQNVIENVLNANTIVGNWEVQNYYKDVLKSKQDQAIDPETGKLVDVTGAQEFFNRFGRAFYTGAWNHFQDFYHHYDAGAFYRKQTISIQDDLEITENNPSGLNADINGDVITKYGEKSNVAATSASINTDTTSSAYNPQVSARKTYKKFTRSSNGATEDVTTKNETVGLPYTWKRVDSLNADFRPEVGLSGKWLSENWDISLDDYNGVSFNNKDWYTADNINAAYIQTLRIHSSINFDGAYQVRPGQDSPDILWMRIESEPMLYHPDTTSATDKVRKSVTGLNSVNQIIINANYSNYNTYDKNYRPFIIFYDGPEYYETNKEIRASKPVILNLNVPWRGVLYAPNSPVVVTGAAQEQFVGFVVAKEYHRLADDNEHKDFVQGGYRYFDSESRKNEYTRSDDGTYYKGNALQSGKDDSNVYALPVYYLKTDTEKTTRYYRITADKNENGIEMFVDDHGDIATVKLTSPPTKCGKYDNFGRTDFTTHGYKVLGSSANNMLLSE